MAMHFAYNRKMDKKYKKTSVRQLELLVEFLQNHRNLALGRLRSKEGRELSQSLWEQCAVLLNAESDGGAFRTANYWRAFYTDYKARLNAKITKIRNIHAGTEQGEPVELTPTEEKVALILGHDPEVLRSVVVQAKSEYEKKNVDKNEDAPWSRKPAARNETVKRTGWRYGKKARRPTHSESDSSSSSYSRSRSAHSRDSSSDHLDQITSTLARIDQSRVEVERLQVEANMKIAKGFAMLAESQAKMADTQAKIAETQERVADGFNNMANALNRLSDVVAIHLTRPDLREGPHQGSDHRVHLYSNDQQASHLYARQDSLHHQASHSHLNEDSHSHQVSNPHLTEDSHSHQDTDPLVNLDGQ